MEQQQGADVFFLLMGAILVFAMHGGFAFLEVGTVRHKNQVNALVKILADFAISTTAYFAIGYTLSYGVSFLASAQTISTDQGYHLVKFFFLATFAAAVPAIISGGIAERAKFVPQCVATALMVGLAYPLIEGVGWNTITGCRITSSMRCSARPSRISRARSSFMLLAAGRRWAPCCILGARIGRYDRGRGIAAVFDPVAGDGFVAAVHRLVRLQRDERAEPCGRFRSRRDEFSDGDVRRHPRGTRRRAGTIQVSCITARSLDWSRSARARMSCIRLEHSLPAARPAVYSS